MTEQEKQHAELVYQIIAQNIASRFSGKFEVFFKDGKPLDIKNTQVFGVSIIAAELVVFET